MGSNLCGTSHDPREGFWMVRIYNFPKHFNFRKIWKICDFFCYCFTMYKEKTHTEQQLKVELEKYLYTRHIHFSFF